jgi:HEAT repeat protein
VKYPLATVFWRLVFSCFLFAPLCLGAAESVAVQDENQQRLDTIRYGTESEIAALIQTLKSERTGGIQTKSDEALDEALIRVTQNTRNQQILSGVLGFFADQDKKGLEERAIKAIEERDEEAHETVLSAIEYLGRVKSASALAPLKTLLEAEESSFMGAAFRALGRVASGGNAQDKDDIAAYLVDFYTQRTPPDQSRREIIQALGETGSKAGLSLLIELAGDNQERGALRMVALEGLSKIADSSGLDPILEALSSTDPNVRSTAVAALGPFSGQAVDEAILESFRDAYYRTRIGAASAAGTRQLSEAIPYLQYRAERDEVPAVRDEAIKSLGAIGNAQALGVLERLLEDPKQPIRSRIKAATMLLESDPSSYADKVIAQLDDAKKTHQTALYNGFLGALGEAKTGKLEDLARRFLDTGGIVEKSYALDMILRNELRSLAPDVRPLATEEKNTGLARKAQNILDHFGLN